MVSLLLGAGVFSHFVLDFITHRKEMQLYPGAPHDLGLELWASLPGTVITECAMFAVSIFLYMRATKSNSFGATMSFAAFVVFLLASYFGNVFGPPPPSVTAIAVTALVIVPLLSLWMWSFDRKRTPRAPAGPSLRT
jgi:hypothetical protein